MKPSKAFFVSRNIFVMKGRNWKMRYGKHRTHARIVGQWAHAFCKLYGYAKQGKLRKCHGHSDDSDCGPHSQLTSEFPTHLHSGWWPRSRICWESPGMEKKILEILYNSRMLHVVSVYRSHVIPWVKGSVPVFFLKLHHRGERGRKGRGVQISKQRTQNLWPKDYLEPCTYNVHPTW